MEDSGSASSFEIGLRKFISGGTAGCLTWFTCYPMDTVKTKMQIHDGKGRLKLTHVLYEIVT